MIGTILQSVPTLENMMILVKVDMVAHMVMW